MEPEIIALRRPNPPYAAILPLVGQKPQEPPVCTVCSQSFRTLGDVAKLNVLEV
jgi:hypothetical protein